MGWLSWLWQLLGGAPRDQRQRHETTSATRGGSAHGASDVAASEPRLHSPRRTLVAVPPRLTPTRVRPQTRFRIPVTEVPREQAYRYARPGSRSGHFLDLSQDTDAEKLRERDLPILKTPDDLAVWLNLPHQRLAWLVHRFTDGRPQTAATAHYHFHWKPKRSGGHRLIEAPKATLHNVQSQILTGILEKLSIHPAAHGFVPGRSILSNARPHVGQAVVLKFDLSDFYANVRFARVVAIFRAMGYGREVAIWLARLTTSSIPLNLAFPRGDAHALFPYLSRHLPQGAPTSPWLANLSAARLDRRLAGFARAYHARYTRYGDDLTFSGDERFAKTLRVVIPLIQQILRQERFHLHRKKRRVLRRHQRQAVTGVVVNDQPSAGRAEFDQLKAILFNCVRHGAASQNRDQHPDFRSHLRGRIAYMQQLNPARGAKLLALFTKIAWN